MTALKSKRILIVDDKKQYIDNLKTLLLQSLGNKVEIKCEYNGLDGIKTARDFLPDIIFMDYFMPQLDGISAMEELKKNNLTCNIFIVIMSAENNVDTRGCPFVKKPANVQIFKDMIERHSKTQSISNMF